MQAQIMMKLHTLIQMGNTLQLTVTSDWIHSLSNAEERCGSFWKHSSFIVGGHAIALNLPAFCILFAASKKSSSSVISKPFITAS